MEQATNLLINGKSYEVNADSEASLLEVLRDDLGFTGAKYGCGESECGACTVLVDGQPTHSCVTAIGDVAAKPIRTVEGLAKGGKLHPMQQAFLDEGAMQCAYCVPGMIVAAVGLLERNPKPTDAEIVDAMSANICRCGGYPRMVAAVKRASKDMESSK
jgi:aerobic-type carbon monoxide dehydrogenase small subunit (CoxS/CutS family)